ncbi:MAG: 4-hydroxy-tetrahydrodipicolinate synthase [Flavobacteriales bacterium]
MNTDITRFRGLGVAMTTPFQKDGELDLEGLEKLTVHLINNDADFLVVQGTTGEAVTMTEDEKRLALDKVIEVNGGRLPVVLGFSGNDTNAQVRALKEWNMKGLDALLVASPYYNKPDQKGLYHHYQALAKATETPIILYNVPGRTGSNILPDTVIRLAEDFEAIIGIKEASGNMGQVMDLISRKPEGFPVLSGEDDLTLPILGVGGEGVISVVGNAYPRIFRRMVWAALQGDLKEAQKEHYALLPIIKGLFEEGNPCGIKELLMHIGIGSNTVRPPLVNVSKELSNRLLELSRKKVLQGDGS